MDLDRYLNWLTTLLITSCGAGPVTAGTRIRPEIVDRKTVVVVHVSPSPKPVFAKTSKDNEAFYVRANNTTRQLSIPSSEWDALITTITTLHDQQREAELDKRRGHSPPQDPPRRRTSPHPHPRRPALGHASIPITR